LRSTERWPGHFPVDSAAGAVLGVTLGHYLAARGWGDDHYPAAAFDGEAYPEREDFTWNELYLLDGDASALNYQKAYVKDLRNQALQPQANALTWLWGKARAEWT
jgi:hypothetical protein